MDFKSTYWVFSAQGKLTEHILLFSRAPCFIFHTVALIHAWELPSATTGLHC